MSLIDLIFGTRNKKGVDADMDTNGEVASMAERTSPQNLVSPREEPDVRKWAFIDTEVGLKDLQIHDIGALRYDGATFHKNDKPALERFLDEGGVDFVCGHNIVHHDAVYLFGEQGNQGANSGTSNKWHLVDTLYLSPLLFPKHPYHRLVKDDKLLSDQMNNPVNDCEKARDLLMDEIAQWNGLSERMRNICSALLYQQREFQGFLTMMKAQVPFTQSDLVNWIRTEYEGMICAHADIVTLIDQSPCGLAYALALIGTGEGHSVTPGWVLHNYPEVEHSIKVLCHTRCGEGCDYCDRQLDVHHNLKRFFGYDDFRTYNGEPLQERAAQAAVDGKSLLAIFPTGGGKSLTFQLPALMDGNTVHGLTVVISPLQSLMKDQVDNLSDRGITDAVTINGLLDPITRSLAIERVQNGDASLLYIAPEMLRSKTIERILLGRNVVRFVIDEAHCFSAWGQDFRVDYMYIGKFIQEYQKKKFGDKVQRSIPISCFTATAKQKVIQDICDYFKYWLKEELQLFASSASRTNLRYSVIHVDSDEGKYARLRSLIEVTDCPTIVYVSRTKRTRELASKLTRDGLKALPYNGKMDADEKVQNQDAFMSDQVRIIVATSAFGMGVDKSDVGLVVHYDISDSLENYVQEAGRAGRDPHLNAKCFVLYSDNDLDKHFILLNQTKLSISEIQQVWKAVKDFTKQRPFVNCSALEIARQAGWDDSVSDIETRVRTALSALEQGGYIERGVNVPHVYATGITVKNMDEARKRIVESPYFSADEIEKVVRIIKSLITQKYIATAQDYEAESRVDYLADILGLSKKEIISAVERMRQEGILADTFDITAYLQDVSNTRRKPQQLLENFARLERYILEHIPDASLQISYKQLNDNAVRDGIETSTEKHIRTLLYFLTVKGYTRKTEDTARNVVITKTGDIDNIIRRFEKRIEACRFIVDWLYKLAEERDRARKAIEGPTANADMENGVRQGAVNTQQKADALQFSVVELLKEMQSSTQSLFTNFSDMLLEDVKEALLYLSKIGALKLEGGFLVLYNAMSIRRIKEPKYRYKLDDYRMLNEFYKQKIQQIHIVGEYANLMVKDYDAALQYVQDYFRMDYQRFVSKYFKGDRVAEIERNLTPARYKKLFGGLSDKQQEIIGDKDSRCIVVAAGPGSGKTRVLVHKLASILTLEDVKHEQLLMLTFSRAAATEFKQRLIDLIGNAANFVEIKTFHSYCFDLLGRIGNLEEVDDVVSKAAAMIDTGEVEPNRIGKTVLVIDEAQDMSEDDFALISALMKANEEMRVIAVGDDDQNIYEFRGSDSQYMYRLSQVPGGRLIEMTENYRSARHIVDAANAFVRGIGRRIKSTPIVSMSKEDGMVRITQHVSRCMYEPMANDVACHGKGTTCVLTQTNEEAVIMLALLCKRGIKGKLIQSMDGFRFWNLAETKYFIKLITTGMAQLKSPLISDELWQGAKQKTFMKYATSEALPYLQRCVTLFEQTNQAKYYSDLCEFIFESSVEDFCDVSDAEVVVSTIHKAKGREFDHVYMLITAPMHDTDEVLRRYYVAMTRAKRTLSIHTTCYTNDGIRFYGNVFSSIISSCRSVDAFVTDQQDYNSPDEIVLQLSHKDVNLGFSKPYKKEILSLRSGDSLDYHDLRLSIPSTGRDVALLSKDMQRKLTEWRQKGYCVTSAIVRFIVAWKPKDAPKEEEESAVLLADLVMRKTDNPK